MDIKTIRKILEAKTVPTINRLANLNYDYDRTLSSVKRDILSKECEARFMKLCETQEEEITTILENKHPITNEQVEMSDLLHEISKVAQILEPPIKEDEEESDPKNEEESNKWIGVDLDGTLAHYEKFEGPEIIGEPIEPMVNRVKQWLEDGKNVKIMTARAAPQKGVRPQDVEEAIRKWCVENIGQELEITFQKDQNMEELWDDRAIQIIKNTGERADGQK